MPNPNTPDNARQPPLIYHAVDEHDPILQRILEQEHIILHMQCNVGKTPLWVAMSLSRNQVAQLLLKREDVNPNLCENGERTPVIQAAICGHEETVRILLARKHANSNIADNARHTAVAHSWQAGKAAVWRLQSKLQAANPSPPLYTQRAGDNASGVGGIVVVVIAGSVVFTVVMMVIVMRVVMVVVAMRVVMMVMAAFAKVIVWSIGDNYPQITKKHGRQDQKCI